MIVKSAPRILIVDDDVQTCDLLIACTCSEFNAVAFNCAETFLKTPLNDSDIILLDLKMPNIDGIEVIRALAQLNKNCALLLMSGYDDSVLHSATMLAKEYGLNIITEITKPIKLANLMKILNSLKKTTIVNCPFLSTNNNSSPSIKPTLINTSTVITSTEFTPRAKDLLQAINQDQLVLFYQPQLNLKTNKLTGVEALIRWQHPIYGLIFPDTFIPLAEETGLIEQLTEKVIRLAIQQSDLWLNKNLHIKISINISAQNITSLTLPEQLTNLVKNSKIDPSMLMLEITETELMTELTTSLDILTRLRLKGFQLSIDDFGTGYSSLSQLHRAPFTELKIDRSFTMSMLTNDESRSIVETCILLGHNLHMEVIAEGVESQEIWDVLTEMGCDLAQGYFIAKALPVNQFEHWLTQQLV